MRKGGSKKIPIVGCVFILFVIYLFSFLFSGDNSQEIQTSQSQEGDMNPYVITLAGVKMPRIIYGTAWKKSETLRLVKTAIYNGFRGIDTACQPKHYNEKLVGDAVKEIIDEKFLKREDLFLQTKFTPVKGQDINNIPYNPDSPLKEQVRDSFKVSLSNLNTEYIDSLVLHSPLPTLDETLEVWKVFEEFVTQGKVKQLGISNIYDIDLLEQIWEESTVKPSVVCHLLAITHRHYQ
eukprot:TRINITY_DN1631_c1_g1_i2.p1 TRINITY_DN1631_c1_g1~~TRINITY_DN1631_c1_g1_i2.p1  ORF type:complete len:236 (+),score=46.97 TRINITY_DN1631_c1_g1_i2:267-974(+)